MQQRSEQLERARVGPVQVIEDEHERFRRSEPLEQLAHGTVNAVALVLQNGSPSAGVRSERRKDLCQFGAHMLVEELETARIQRRYVFVECVHDDTERELTLELGARSVENEISLGVGAGSELRKQSRLANTRLTCYFKRCRTAFRELAERAVQRIELSVSPDEMLGDLKRRALLTLARFNQSTRSSRTTAST
jgi:hypothetical protein